ncbi:MAG: hypothetical protein KAR22_16390 [Gammaproteobacteria bacterium]|nr:hypothetical protein [Gammaproteobacteria bacterium]
MKKLTALAITTLLLVNWPVASVYGDDGDAPRITTSLYGTLDPLQEYFNQHQGELRFVTLLSPT